MKSVSKSRKPAILVISGFLLVGLAAACAGINQAGVINLPVPTSAGPAPVTETAVFTDTSAAQIDPTQIAPVDATAAPTQADPTATTAPAAPQVSFARDVLPIFQANCTGCHGPDRQAAGLDLSNYAAIMNTSPAIVPNDPNNSVVLQAIIRGVMPRGGAPLSDQDIQTITNWINAGAPNN